MNCFSLAYICLYGSTCKLCRPNDPLPPPPLCALKSQKSIRRIVVPAHNFGKCIANCWFCTTNCKQTFSFALQWKGDWVGGREQSNKQRFFVTQDEMNPQTFTFWQIFYHHLASTLNKIAENVIV